MIILSSTSFLVSAEALTLTLPSGPNILDRKSTRLNSSHSSISYAVFCLKKKNKDDQIYKNKFQNLTWDLLFHKSVSSGDIDTDNSDEYIKRLIHHGYLTDTTVLVILIGPKTFCRFFFNDTATTEIYTLSLHDALPI